MSLLTISGFTKKHHKRCSEWFSKREATVGSEVIAQFGGKRNQ